MDRKIIGKKCWVIPDGFIPLHTERDKENVNGYISHECICILNNTQQDVTVELIFYFEEHEPVIVKDVVVKAQRSRHLRINDLLINGKQVVSNGIPYSLIIKSSGPVFAQMSRLDTTQNNMAFLSTMAYSVD